MGRFRVASRKVRTIVRVVAALLFSVLCVPTLLAQESASLNDYPGTSLSGLTTAQVELSLDQCRKICIDRTGCTGFDHSSTTNQCRLFGGIASARDDSSSNAATRYPVPGYRPPTSQIVAKSFQHYPNFDLFGFDLAQGPADSMVQCESLCRDNAECKAFTYNEWNQKCFLKSGTNELRLEPRAQTGVLIGDVQPGYRNAQVVMEYYHGYTMSGSQTGNPRVATTRDQCESMCWGSNQCIAFSFVKTQRECRLFNHASNRFPKAGVESGSKIQPRP